MSPSLPHTHSLSGINLLTELSRTPSEKQSSRNNEEMSSDDHESSIFITGRIILNGWKRMKSELKLQIYTHNYVSQELLNRKIPFFSQEQLMRWFVSTRYKDRTLRHIFMLAELNIQVIVITIIIIAVIFFISVIILIFYCDYCCFCYFIIIIIVAPFYHLFIYLLQIKF